MSIKGYVMPIYAKNLKQFIDQKSTAGTQDQEAFSLAVKFTDQYSAPQVLINLPGSATCIESMDHPVGIEELDTITAVNIEKDALTAAPIGNLMGFVEEYKRRNTNKGGCWLSNYICGGEEEQKEKKSIRGASRRSSRSSKKSAKSAGSSSCRSQSRKKNKKSQVNVCLEATPCGGSTIQA